MSGPALNPIANIAPAAPPKGPDASNQDVAAQSEPDKAGTGFASELQRQMKGNSPPEDEQGTQSDSDADAAARAAATVQAQQPPLQPELAALLGGLLPAALSVPATDLQPIDTIPATSEDGVGNGEVLVTSEGDAVNGISLGSIYIVSTFSPALSDYDFIAGSLQSAAPRGGSIETALRLTDTHARPASLTPEAATRATSGNGDLQTAESAARNPASFAASPGKGEDASLHGSPSALADTPLRAAETPVAATPTNSFAAIHAAALANLQGAAPPPAPAPVPMHVATPAGSPGWPEEVGNRVSWMVGQTESHAELTLTPPQLGKVEISITVSGDQTSAQFVAATPAARELIEQSLPRLREILEQSGISLGQTDVGTSGQPGDPERSPRGSQWRGSGGGDEKLAASAVPAQWARRGEGLVDTFA